MIKKIFKVGLFFVSTFFITTQVHAATITGLSVTGTNLSAGQTSSYTINYTIPTANPNIMFYMRFPSSFDVSAIGFPMNLSNVSVTVNGTPAAVDSAGSWAIQGSTTAIRLVTSATVTAGASVSVTFNNIVNPSSAGAYPLSDFFATATAQGVQIDTAASIPTITITADTTPPTAPGVPTFTTGQTNNPRPTASWAASIDTDSGIASYTVRWTQNSNCTGGTTATTTSTSHTVSSNLADGSWYFCVTAQDVAGNTSGTSPTGMVIVDTVAPVLTTISSIPQYVSLDKAYYYFSSSELCSIVALPPTSTLGAVETRVGAITDINATVTAYLAGVAIGGTYSGGFSCVDPAGNTSNTLAIGPFTIPVPHAGIVRQVQPTAAYSNQKLGFVTRTVDKKVAVFDLNADPKTVSGYAISLDKNFTNGTIQPFTNETKTATIVLPDTKEHTVYLFYYSTTGARSEVFSQLVQEKKPLPTSKQKTPVKKVTQPKKTTLKR